MSRTNDDILAAVKDQQVEFISLQFTDIIGMVKNVTIPVAQLTDCLDHGVWFDGSAIEGFARIAESDMFLVPDLETFAIVPWDQGAGFTTARMICDVFTPDGKPFAGDPRYVLKTALEDCAKLGLIYNVGPELEFFLFKTDADGQPAPDPNDAAGYFDVSTDMASHIRRHMVRALASFGIEVEALHHEVAVGQHEIDFKYGPALRTADHAVTFRMALKAVAQQHGLYATFMPKPLDRHQRQRHARPSELQRCRDRAQFVLRCRRSLWPFADGAAVHRRAAGARQRHDRHPGPAGEFVQAAGAGL